MKFNKVKKIIFYILTIPFHILSMILRVINYDSLNDDLNLCLKLIYSNNKKSIPSQLIDFLIAAEDHRYCLHFGIDQYAIIRAVFVRWAKKEYQGASTIEQQFIRVVTNRFEKTSQRKFREQMLAICLLNKIKNKKEIAKNYILIAYYGYKANNLNQYLHRKNKSLENLTELDMLELIAKLKYPEPSNPSNNWNNKLNNRVNYIRNRFNYL